MTFPSRNPAPTRQTAPARRVPEDARPTPPRAPSGPLFDEPAGDPPAPPPAPPAPEKPRLQLQLPVSTLREAHPILCKPFPQHLIELKPGATTKDRTRALVMPYADPRAYFTRLDRVVGPDGWQVEYRVPAPGQVICRLTILGHVREDVGECHPSDENAFTSAAMQALKRACAAFGIGRYLYSLPQLWTDYDDAKKQITGDRAAIVRQMYAALPQDED